MESKKLKKLFKLVSVSNISPPIARNLRIAPYVKLRVGKITKAVNLNFSLELSFQNSVFQSVKYVQSVSSEGDYIIPLPLDIKKIPSEAKEVNFTIELRVGRNVVAKKTILLSASNTRNQLAMSLPYVKRNRIIAGKRQDCFCDLKNTSNLPISMYFEILLIPLGGEEIRVFGEPRNIPPGRPDQIQARYVASINLLGECFIVARVKFKQGEQELEQCTVRKTTVQLSPEPVMEIKISDSPQIPTAVEGGKKVNFNVKVLQNIEKTKLRFDVLVTSENWEKKLKTFEIKQQKGEYRNYGPVTWDTPKVSEKTTFYIDFKVYKDGQPLPEEGIKKEKKKITLTPA
ncbi:MAG: hypothetical protein KIH08_09570 [Candidatus Freyarchaeota archaeon]|nr:hypothetical protein [Candidatus Jordarchaeia archaeon]